MLIINALIFFNSILLLQKMNESVERGEFMSAYVCIM